MTDPAHTATLVHLDPNTLHDHPSNVRDDPATSTSSPPRSARSASSNRSPWSPPTTVTAS